MTHCRMVVRYSCFEGAGCFLGAEEWTELGKMFHDAGKGGP
jgi:hypothetical protein